MLLYYVYYLHITYPYLTLLFFFNDTATTEIYTLSLHDALPIYVHLGEHGAEHAGERGGGERLDVQLGDLAHVGDLDTPRSESTRLNSSHANISYAVFCLKKKIQSRQ